MPRLLRILTFTLLVLGLAHTSIAADEGFKVIVNAANPMDVVDRDVLRDAYLKKTAAWKSGTTIHPIDLVRKFPARDQFTEHVVGKTPTQLKKYWAQQIFSGKGVPPPEVDSVDKVIEYVVANKGA